MNTLVSPGEDAVGRSYNKRKLNRFKQRRELRRSKIFLSRLKILVRLASYVFIVWGLIEITNLPFWYLDKNIFASYPNNYLELEGCNIVSARQVLKQLSTAVLPQSPLYLIDTNPIENKIKEMSPIKKVFVRRYLLPARLKIVVDERTPVLSVAPTIEAPPVAVFTRDFNDVKILENEYLPLPISIKTYKIITYDNYRSWKPALVPYMEAIAKSLETNTDSKLIYLDIRNPDDVYAQMENIRLRIGELKGKEVFKRIDKVNPSVVFEIMKIKNKSDIDYIDLRWNNVSIKLKETGNTDEEKMDKELQKH